MPGVSAITRRDAGDTHKTATMIMKHLMHTLSTAALLTVAFLPLSLQARQGIIPSPAGQRTEFHVEAAFTYVSGMNNVVNQLEKNFGLEDDESLPIGLKISGYVRMENGFAVGGGIGPCQYYRVRTYHPRHGDYSNRDYYYDDYYYDSGYRYHDDDIESSYIIPVFADVRYYFPKNVVMSPYVRVGIAYPISGGDHLSAGTPGAIGAVGAQFLETRYVAIGVELGFDDSRVQVRSGPFHPKEKVRPTEFTLSVSAVF